MYLVSKIDWLFIIAQIQQIFGKTINLENSETLNSLSEECQNWPFADELKTQLNEKIQAYSNAKPPI